jgi:tricorn protease-like protein
MKTNLCLLSAILLASCTVTVPEGKKSDDQPYIFPDYAGTVIPPNIAPLHFELASPIEAYAVFTSGDISLTVKAKKGSFNIQPSPWKKLLAVASGDSISVTITARLQEDEWTSYAPFSLHVAAEPVDPYIAYRLIEPVYELWNRMGIYQRNLENYAETPILENEMTGKNCMNCHSFPMQNPGKMLLHTRATYSGTLLVDGDKIEKLNTETEQTIAPLVYPSWHPSGRYVAFSVNRTKQGFHHNDRNRIEVFDDASDVVVYDVESHEIVTTAALFAPGAFETFPSFSPDGKTLYFCSAPAQDMPASFKEVKYSLCSIAFNPGDRTFGSTVDTLYNAAEGGKSASFPRVSPDGKHLIYTLSGYGNFSIWHEDADLYMLKLADGTSRPMEEVNSPKTDSYHSWSSNSRWIVFSSRRIDGLYTRPFIAYVNSEGKASKPFLLPQKDTDFYRRFMKSYNIPEFITGKVTVSSRKLALKAKKDAGVDLTFLMR